MSWVGRLLARQGIDLRQVAALFVMYLKQDLRSGKSSLSFRRGEYVTSNWGLILTLGIYSFLGLTAGSLVFAGVDVLLFSVIVLSFTLFIVALALSAESGNVILNESEADILGHLPIGSKTLFIAKVMNLLAFTLALATAANLFPTFFGVWAGGSNVFFIPGHILSATMVSLFATALIVVSYGVLMRLVSKDRFDNIVAYSQAVLTMMFMLGPQLIPRLMDRNHLKLVAGFQRYFLLYPPAWFSGITMLFVGRFDLDTLALSSIGIASLLVLGAVALKKVAVGYSGLAGKLASASGSVSSDSIVTGARRSSESRARSRGGDPVIQAMKARLLRSSVERAVFDLVSIYLRRNREIKVRLYPSLAYFIFYPLLAIFGQGLVDPFSKRGFALFPLVGAEMVCFVALTAVEGLLFSEDYQAAYIFEVAPLPALRQVYAGFRKAILVYIAGPGYLALFVLYSIFWRNPVDAFLILLPWMMMAPGVLAVPFLLGRRIPLSRKYQKGQQSSRNLGVFLFTLIGLSSVLGVQILATNGTIPYWLFLVLVAVPASIFYLVATRVRGSQGPQLRIENHAENAGRPEPF
jgi:ABC-2 type transport system permease protein